MTEKREACIGGSGDIMHCWDDERYGGKIGECQGVMVSKSGRQEGGGGVHVIRSEKRYSSQKEAKDKDIGSRYGNYKQDNGLSSQYVVLGGGRW